MKTIKSLTLSCLALLVIVLGCTKDDKHPHPVDPPAASMHINLTYLSQQAFLAQDSLKKYELIISETGGKILLDTIGNFNMPIVTDIVTNDQLVDVSVIRHTPFTNSSWYINSYKAVNPSSWITIPASDSSQYLTSVTLPYGARILYRNVPALAGDPFWLATDFYGATPGNVTSSPDMTITYAYYPAYNKYAYLLFPTRQLFDLHRLKSNQNDTIDIAKMDTAESRTLNISDKYSVYNYLLYGYPDSTDLAYNAGLYISVGSLAATLPPIIYPGRKGFQKYDLTINAFNTGVPDNQTTINLYNIDTIPAVLAFLDETYYTVASKQNNNFSISFAHKPVLYTVSGFFKGNGFDLNAPADSTVLHPLDFLRSLKSQLLKNEDFSSLQLGGLNLQVEGAPDYQTYWKNNSNNLQVPKRHLTSQVRLNHTL